MSSSPQNRSNLHLLAELSASLLPSIELEVERGKELNEIPKNDSSNHHHSNDDPDYPNLNKLDEEANTTQPQTIVQPNLSSSSNPLPEVINILSFRQFIEQYPSYPTRAGLCYKIYCDLTLKKEFNDLQIEDGALYFELSDYFFVGKIKPIKRRKQRRRKQHPTPSTPSVETTNSTTTTTTATDPVVSSSSSLPLPSSSSSASALFQRVGGEAEEQQENREEEAHGGSVSYQYIFPMDASADIDLLWLKKACMKCEGQGGEVVIAVGNVESVV